jgi:hypothetical protein
MKKNITLTNLLLAAVAFLAATVPCFAQSASTESPADSTSVSSTRDSGVTLALNNVRATAPAFRFREAAVSPTTTVAKNTLKLTPSAFKVSDELTSGSERFFGTAQIYQSDTLDSKRQFRVDEDTPTEQSKVTFVPSRGPRMPN